MRFGTIFQDSLSAVNYRAFYPLRALQRRGHDVVVPPTPEGWLTLADQFACDAVLIYRRQDERAQRTVTQLHERGIGVVYDNDDDFRHLPMSPIHSDRRALQRDWKASVEMARRADVATATTAALAERYAVSGAPGIEVIDNQLAPRLRRKTRRHDGFVIGWVAGIEHSVDARELRIRDTLAELQRRHPEVRVECVGVDLGLGERYRHAARVDFDRLPDVMSGWDLAIAPLANVPLNTTRSSIKVKEYAASQLPWLASPVGPYLGLGEDQGGMLVPDGEWLAALTALVDDKRARKRLAKAGERWAKTQTTDAVAATWEAVLTGAAERARARTQARARVPA
jgi:glycosyltransferase involved in cell wall biosynthesis